MNYVEKSYPVGGDVAFPVAFVFSGQGMVSIFKGEWLAGTE